MPDRKPHPDWTEISPGRWELPVSEFLMDSLGNELSCSVIRNPINQATYLAADLAEGQEVFPSLEEAQIWTENGTKKVLLAALRTLETRR